MRLVPSMITRSTPSLVTTKGHSGRSHHPRKSETPIDFVGVDGEGVTTPTGHRYVLFGVGDKQISSPEGLNWKEIFEHAYAQYRPGTAFVGFFLGYDFSQCFKTLPESRARILLTSEGMALRKHRIPGKSPHPVEYAGWHFDILGNKRLRIRPKGCTCEFATCKHKHDPWMYICDVGPFFQAPFLKVIDPKGWAPGTEVVSEEEFKTIRIGKERRADAQLDDEMCMYNRLENEVLVRVMKNLDRGFHEMGVHLPPSKWFGPGQAAQAWMKKEKIPTAKDHEGIVPQWFMEAARMAYFGGWFEPFIHGIIPGTSHEYDINSAYPWIISKLPCLLHGRYTHGVGLPPRVSGDDLCLVYGNVWSPGMPDKHHRQAIGSMLHRDYRGRILRPLATQGWYWWDELTAAANAGLVKRLDNRGKQQITKWVKYEPCDCPPPFRKVEELYLRRLQYGKKSPQGMAAKYIYNSKYGKAAQSIGDPLFANAVYASRITSGCRRMVLEAIGSHPDGQDAVAMVATDAVYFLSPHPSLPLSERLGEWEHCEHENLTIFKPGVYWDDTSRRRIAEGETPEFKARGFKAADLAAQLHEVDSQFTLWESQSENVPFVFPEVEFKPAFSMVTALQALRRHKWELAGSVTGAETAVPLRQSANPKEKRERLFRDVYQGRMVFRSNPHYGMDLQNGRLTWIPSSPYEKRFGMDDPWSAEYQSQLGETPDGMIGDLLAWVLNSR